MFEGDETDDIIVYGQLDGSYKYSPGVVEQAIVHMRTARILPPQAKSRLFKRRPRPDDPLPRGHAHSSAVCHSPLIRLLTQRPYSHCLMGIVQSDEKHHHPPISTRPFRVRVLWGMNLNFTP